MAKNQNQLHTVERALRVLSIFNENKNEYSLNEIAKELNIPKTMVFRTLQTLESAGYVVKNNKTKQYTLGLEVFRLGKAVEKNFEIKKIALPHMKELNNLTKETVCLVVPDLALYRAACILTLETHHTIKYSTEMGTVGYFHCGASRKTILAYLGDDTAHRIIDHTGLPRLTKNTVTDRTQLFEQLQKIREEGYTISREEAIPELFSIASPIFNINGQIVGSLAVNLPLYRVTAEKEAELIHLIKLYGSRISNSLGYQPY